MKDTKTKILSILLRGGKTADLIASTLAIQKSAVRRHLEQLIKSGKVYSTFEKKGVGRPLRLYWITLEGRELFTTQYHYLLNQLLDELESKASDESSRFMKNIAKKMSLSSNVKDMTSLKDYLDSFGFETDVAEKDDYKSIYSYNCPVLKVAKRHQQAICQAFHTSLLADILKAKKINLEKCMVWNDPYCLHTIN
ncbi:MAG: ArsR family transcriptional regulator [Conexivisphaerales archaeon]